MSEELNKHLVLFHLIFFQRFHKSAVLIESDIECKQEDKNCVFIRNVSQAGQWLNYNGVSLSPYLWKTHDCHRFLFHQSFLIRTMNSYKSVVFFLYQERVLDVIQRRNFHEEASQRHVWGHSLVYLCSVEAAKILKSYPGMINTDWVKGRWNV